MAEVDGCRIKTGYGLLESEGEVVVDVDRRGGKEVHIKEFGLLLFGFASLFAAFTLFFLLLSLLFQLFLALGTLFGDELQGIYPINQLLQGVGLEIGELHLQGIYLVDE